MTSLRRALGLPGATFYGLGLILGAGIYSIVGPAAGLAGPVLWQSFLVSAAVALLTGLSYAELASMYPSAGAEFEYVRAAFPRRPGLATVVGLLFAATGMATAATVSLAFAGYLRVFAPVAAPVVAAALVLAVTGVNLLGIRESSRTNIAMTLVEVGGLALVVGLGLSRPLDVEALLALPHPGVLAGAGLVFFAFLGFEDIANLAEETRDPTRTIPRAIVLAVSASALLYVLVAVAAVMLAPPQALAASDSPLATAVSALAPRLGGLLAAVALFATANTSLAALLGASRMLFAMGRRGRLPAALARVLPGRRTPWVASLAVAAGALVLLPTGGVAVVGSVSSLAALAVFLAVDVALVQLRRTEPARPRPFRVRGAVRGVPVVPVLGAVGALVLASRFEARAYVILAAIMAAVLGVAWVQTRRRRGAVRGG